MLEQGNSAVFTQGVSYTNNPAHNFDPFKNYLNSKKNLCDWFFITNLPAVNVNDERQKNNNKQMDGIGANSNPLMLQIVSTTTIRL